MIQRHRKHRAQETE